MNATQLWNQYNTFRNRKVKQYVPAVYKALQTQLQYFADTGNYEMIPMEPVATVIKDIYMDAGRNWAHQTYLNVLRDVGLKSPHLNYQTKRRAPIGYNEDFINSILEYFQLQLLNDAVLPISSTTKDWIRKSLSDGIAEGQSIDEIVNEILASGITLNRANVITRTEIGKAANYGEQLGTDKTGLATNKVWISVRDNRTRRDHVTVDNQVQPDGKPFIVGFEQYEMQRPGVSKSDDGRKIPAKEVVNCRCVVGRKVLRGKDGLPLRKVV